MLVKNATSQCLEDTTCINPLSNLISIEFPVPILDCPNQLCTLGVNYRFKDCPLT
ncbi:MAG: hypothetical protein IPP08_05295 [Chlorobiota bacterium]|nr:hypothetical protein [Chlorobiota bacterium]QQS67581.1 MAG: hypothetical protein IPP08_05295 [Chlorobiota bacterium]